MKYSVEMYVPKNVNNYSLMLDKLTVYNKFEFISITDGIDYNNTDCFIKFLNNSNIDLSKICLHISYMNRGKQAVHDILDYVRRETTIKNLFLVRGNKWLNRDYNNIIDVINDIQLRYNKYFTLYSSFYPDGYSYFSLEKSAEYALLKIAHGCDYLISQYTTNYSNMERFKSLLDRFELGQRLIPSVLPLIDSKAVNIANSLNSETNNNVFISEKNAIYCLKKNISELNDIGFNHVHIFSLNHVRFLNEIVNV